jgi:hypothetical protein
MSAGREPIPVQPREEAAILRSSIATPIAMSCFAVFLALIGVATFAAGGPSAWWAFLPPMGLAAFAGWSVVRVLKNRRLLALEVTRYSLSMGRVAVTRKEVTAVRQYKELRFKGVRIDLADGRWMGIPYHHHHPTRVLRALRDYGYPVES